MNTIELKYRNTPQKHNITYPLLHLMMIAFTNKNSSLAFYLEITALIQTHKKGVDLNIWKKNTKIIQDKKRSRSYLTYLAVNDKKSCWNRLLEVQLHDCCKKILEYKELCFVELLDEFYNKKDIFLKQNIFTNYRIITKIQYKYQLFKLNLYISSQLWFGVLKQLKN